MRLSDGRATCVSEQEFAGSQGHAEQSGHGYAGDIPVISVYLKRELIHFTITKSYYTSYKDIRLSVDMKANGDNTIYMKDLV